MEDLFKKFLYTGVGFVALTAEKLQESIDELVGDGKLSKDEGKKIVDDFKENTESKKEEFERRLKEAADNVINKLSFPNMEDYQNLVKRVDELEAKLAATEKKPAAKAPAKKTTVRKTTRTAKKKTDDK